MGLSTVSSELVSRRQRTCSIHGGEMKKKKEKKGEEKRERYTRAQSSERRKWKPPKWSDAALAQVVRVRLRIRHALYALTFESCRPVAAVDEQVITLKALYTYFPRRRYTYGAAGDKIQSNK